MTMTPPPEVPRPQLARRLQPQPRLQPNRRSPTFLNVSTSPAVLVLL